MIAKLFKHLARSKLKKLFLYSLLIFIPALISIIWFLNSQTGLQFVLKQVDTLLPSDLSFDNVQGSILGPITINEFNYQQIDVNIRAKKITLDWSPSSLLFSKLIINNLQIKSLSISISDSNTTSSQQQIVLPDIVLPIAIELHSSDIESIKVSNPTQHYVIDKLLLSANAESGTSKIKINALNVNAYKTAVTIAGYINVNANYAHNIEINWTNKFVPDTTMTGSGTISGNLIQSTLQHQISGVGELDISASINNVLSDLHWSTELKLSNFNLSRLNKNWPVITTQMQLQAEGNINNATLTGQSQSDHPEFGLFSSKFKLTRLDNNRIQIDDITFENSNKSSIKTIPQISVRGHWTPSDNIKGDNITGELSLAVQWQNLRWPLQQQLEPVIDTAVGNGWIKSSNNKFHIELATSQQFLQTKDHTLLASIDGIATDNKLIFNSVTVSELDETILSRKSKQQASGLLSATGELHWSPELSWNSKIKLSNINPAIISKHWPGNFNATVTNSGRIENKILHIHSKLNNINGTLRGYPVSGTATLDWHQNGLDITKLELYSGESRFSAQGKINSSLKMSWNLNSNNIAELYPKAHGKLYVSGYLSGNRTNPYIHTQIVGSDIKIAKFNVASINANAGIDLFSWQKINIQLDAKNISNTNFELDSVNISGNNSELNGLAIFKQLTAQLKLVGQSDNTGWHGFIEQASIQSEKFKNWKLASKAKLSIQNSSFEMQPLCWINQQSKICADVQHQTKLSDQTDIWLSTLQLSNMPLMLLDRWLPNGLEINGNSDARAEIHYFPGLKLIANAQITLAPGTIHYPLLEGETSQWDYQTATAKFKLDEKQLLYNSTIKLSNGDSVQAQLQLPEFDVFNYDKDDQKLQASIKVDMKNPGLIEALVPQIQDFKGKLNVAITASGTFENPEIEANADLKNGSLRLPQPGLTITQINFSSHNDNFNNLNNTQKINYKLEALSGDGNIQILGSTLIDKQAGWPTTLSIFGNNFTLAKIPIAYIVVSPNLYLTMQHKNITITGEVDVPNAKLKPSDITSADHVSPDAVIGKIENQTDDKWSVTTNVNVTLGKKVTFNGFGFEGKLSGKLKIIDEPQQPTKAIGEILVSEGRYRAYGQKLDVEQGKLLYTGGPLNNPGMDLRAIRKTGDITAGLKVRGSLQYPKVELFSIPTMGQTEVLSYLLLGRSIEESSSEEGNMMSKAALLLSLSSGDKIARSLGSSLGFDEMYVDSSNGGDQASLVIGRYLSPKLYVSYGVGLIESINTFKVRYQISDRWQLIGENGENQGADILYTFDK